MSHIQTEGSQPSARSQRIINSISGRLSLRTPQRESLEALARVEEVLSGEQSLQEQLRVIASEFPSVSDFEREFPSLCFALATGVGKTRLMGAFIAYLFLAGRSRHFFVLAPNLTIYNKLIADFTPGTQKYVFQGIGEFGTRPPVIITGENYESGISVLNNLFDDVHINIFNISKINTEVRGGASPRIKRLSEYIGQSYFDYLAELDDLVLLMDESHRYRASAGVRAINDLKPIMGLELTATPFVEAGRGSIQYFNNVIYSYPLSAAMADGYVKEPAVATRENFNPKNYTEEELERLKLEDGIRIHEHTKVELEVYARQHNLPVVKPFVLVVAADTDHANQIVELIRSEHFFDGRYRDRVITVHSALRGEEKEDTVEKLLAVESPAEQTEIVVHVNMLKEGWDVTNLYTIVPLRAANARGLVEQSIGRGLRLPYGKRTGNPVADRLTVVAHDRFQEIIDDANRPDSIIRSGVVIGRDVPIERQATLVVAPWATEVLTNAPNGTLPSTPTLPAGSQEQQQEAVEEQGRLLFPTPASKQIATKVMEVIGRYETLPSSAELLRPDIQQQITATVIEELLPTQGSLSFDSAPLPLPPPETASFDALLRSVDIVGGIVNTTIQLRNRLSIDIPRIIIQPTGDVTNGYHDFDLEVSRVRLQPVPMNLLIEELRTHQRSRLLEEHGSNAELMMENYLVRALVNYDDISYDQTADLLYKLSGQMVAHLRSYLPTDDDVQNVVEYHQRTLAEMIHAQMQQHFWEEQTAYSAQVTKGFTTLQESTYGVAAGESARNFRTPVMARAMIKGMLFTGFRRCCYRVQKFDSDTERLFAVILENEPEELHVKWLRPAAKQLGIYYNSNDAYQPDFVVETRDTCYLVELKRASLTNDDDVQAKARAATEWCRSATAHARQHGTKPWKYLLIPDTAIAANTTLTALSTAFAQAGQM
ncbi:MAG: type III restriction endonuclease subunit R [Chlorobi bacterium CHB2]|nr:type III restriction endonuclease subunit R [Chlorobi bacterium CHB2]